MNDQAIRAGTVLFQASAGLRPAGATDASRRVVLAHHLVDDLDSAQATTCLLTCLLADLGASLARTTAAGGARQTAALLRSVPGLDEVATAIDHRYERVDGTGHPNGLAGADIPLAARVLALADVLVGGSRRGPIDWPRRIETMKDSAGAALDEGLARSAYELVSDRAARIAIETATADTALAIIARLAGPEPGLAGMARLVHDVHEPQALASALLVQAWPATQFTSIGCHRIGASPSEIQPVASLGADIDDHLHDVLRGCFDGASTVGEVCAVPVRSGDGRGVWGAVWGIIRVGSPAARDLESLHLVASSINAALQRAHREDELTAQAQRDQLTGLANRRRLEAELASLFAGPPESRADAALVMCDVDGLKQVNDSRGHAAGDDVLRAVAVVLTAALEGFDGMAARLGGDEFCLVLRTGGILHAQTVARRATAGVVSSVAGDVGLSCGIAYAARASTPGELLSGADLAQYQAKRRRPGDGGRIDGAPGRRRRRDR